IVSTPPSSTTKPWSGITSPSSKVRKKPPLPANLPANRPSPSQSNAWILNRPLKRQPTTTSNGRQQTSQSVMKRCDATLMSMANSELCPAKQALDGFGDLHKVNDPGSATRAAGGVDCDQSAMAGFVAARDSRMVRTTTGLF